MTFQTNRWINHFAIGFFVLGCAFQPFAGGNPSGSAETFASGFPGKSPLMNPNDAVARPDGIVQGPDGSLYIGESQKGRVWRVLYRGEKK